jgi:hypothetical protein
MLAATLSAHFTYLKDVHLDPGNARSEEDDGEERDSAEHASVDTTVTNQPCSYTSRPLTTIDES